MPSGIMQPSCRNSNRNAQTLPKPTSEGHNNNSGRRITTTMPEMRSLPKNSSGKHQNTIDCKRVTAIKEKQELAKTQKAATNFIFKIQGK